MIRTVHVYQCGTADLYGLTQDRTGANLPASECVEGWRYLMTVDLEGGSSPRGLDVAWQGRDAAAFAGMVNNGFFIGEADALPSEFRHHLG